MTNHKNYNSIVFLTTLSVYLGLMLVGGSAPVLAHAALTRNFDIQNEIEFKDDLDKKPDDEDLKELSGAIGSYFEDLESFLEDLQKLNGIEKFDLDFDRFTFTEKTFVPCNPKGDPVPQHSEIIQRIDNQWLQPAITDAAYKTEGWDFLSDCLPNDKFKTAKSAGIDLSYDKSEFKYGISITKDSPQKAQQLAENFIQSLKLYKLDEEKIVAQKLYENTSIKSENNQVFIVTRLPRGSLDALLAEKDAQ